MAYLIRFQRHGTLMQKFIVPDHNGQPSAQPIKAQMDSRLHKAIDRAQWQPDPLMCDVMVKPLVSVAGQPMGTLVATVIP